MIDFRGVKSISTEKHENADCSIIAGAWGGTRTRTGLPPTDFKSVVSANSTTQAYGWDNTEHRGKGRGVAMGFTADRSAGVSVSGVVHSARSNREETAMDRWRVMIVRLLLAVVCVGMRLPAAVAQNEPDIDDEELEDYLEDMADEQAEDEDDEEDDEE